MSTALPQTQYRSSTLPALQYRGSILSICKLFFLALFSLPGLRAAPYPGHGFEGHGQGLALWARDVKPKGSDDPTLWIYLAIAFALVLAGGAFAGLTIALMGQDEIYLQVIKTSGDKQERKHATSVLRLLRRGKHWVLVTLLLSNVITNETLPIVLDRSLGGGWPAVLGSTVLIVIFGEIIPQSICVRYGLPIGAWMSRPVLVLMYFLAPVAWPTAKLLDKLLGEDHGTTYKKAGLKTLVTLHKTLGEAGDQLNSDEVTIISAVLDLKAKPVGSIMTPMGDVFTMSADTILDESTMDIILSAGYSRIPIHAPDNPLNFVGMLLVKILITYDPEDCKQVRDFALATLPETRPETSCLDIVNYFQEGKSHMVLVTEFPGEDSGAAGVVTLEDVIEELIGEEIIDESDVFIDVHKAIRRMTPAPRTRVPKGQFVTDVASNAGDTEERLIDIDGDGEQPVIGALKRVTSGNQNGYRKTSSADIAQSPKTTFMMRRSSSAHGQSDTEYVTKRSDAPDIYSHLRHLGPSNLAANPRSTRYSAVKIKQGPRVSGDATGSSYVIHETSANPVVSHPPTSAAGGVGEGLVNSAGLDAKDGVMAVQAGQLSSPPLEDDGQGHLQVPTNGKAAQVHESGKGKGSGSTPPSNSPPGPHLWSTHSSRHHSRNRSKSTLASLRSAEISALSGAARSGSITENIVDAGGFKKVVLEMSSSSDEATGAEADSNGARHGKKSKKKPRRRHNGGKKNTDSHSQDEQSGEHEPLIRP